MSTQVHPDSSNNHKAASSATITSNTAPAAEQAGWGKQIEFFLTIVGWAVGLGNIWRFPYLCYMHGGGTFLIPYLIMLFFVGIPIFFFELSLGQFAGVGPYYVWNLSPLFKGLSFAGIAITWMVSLYYNVLIAWGWRYLFACFTSTLPWTKCENDWNSLACIEGPLLKELKVNGTLDDWLAERGMTNADIKTPSEEYFYHKVLDVSGSIYKPGIPVPPLVGCLILSWLLCFLVLIKGIQSLGKSMYFVTIFPYVMMTILVIQGATLPGAKDGIIAYLKPDFTALGKPQMWSDAATQIFYTLGTCSGGLISMASFNPFRNNILRDSLTVPFINGFTSLYSGFAIFSVLGFMAQMKGVEVKDVATDGPGLVFVVYPEALSQMPVAPLWAFFFFLMLITLGYSSVFSMVETVFIFIMDILPLDVRKYKYGPVVLRGVAIFLYLLITIPMITQGGFYLFDITNSFVSGFPMLIVGFGQFAVVSWVYGIRRFSDDIAMMLGKRPNIYFQACWVVISPLSLLTIIIALSVAYKAPPYPAGIQALGWLQVVFAVGWIPAVATVYIIIYAKDWKSFIALTKPAKSWGPRRSEDRTGRYAPHPEEGTTIAELPSIMKPMSVTSIEAQNPVQNTGYCNEGFISEKF